MSKIDSASSEYAAALREYERINQDHWDTQMRLAVLKKQKDEAFNRLVLAEKALLQAAAGRCPGDNVPLVPGIDDPNKAEGRFSS